MEHTSPPIPMEIFLTSIRNGTRLLMAPDCQYKDICYASLCSYDYPEAIRSDTGPVYELLAKVGVFLYDRSAPSNSLFPNEDSSEKQCSYNSYPVNNECVNCPTGYSCGTGQQSISACFLCSFGRYLSGSENIACDRYTSCLDFTPGLSYQYFGQQVPKVPCITEWTGSSWTLNENSNLPVEQFMEAYIANLERACIETAPKDFSYNCTQERYLGKEYASFDTRTYLGSAVFPSGYPNLKGTYSFFNKPIPLFGFEPSGTNDCGRAGTTTWYSPNPGYHYPNRNQDSLGSAEPCPAGSWCPGGTIPLKCPPGSYSSATGQKDGSTCQPCPAGTYSPNYGLSDILQCVPCPGFTYSTKTGLKDVSQCTPCPIGYISSPGATKPEDCYLCSADQYYDTTSHTCPVVHSCNSFTPLVYKPEYLGHRRPIYITNAMTLNRNTLVWSNSSPSPSLTVVEWFNNFLSDLRYICRLTAPQGYQAACDSQFPEPASVISEYIQIDPSSGPYFIKPIQSFGNTVNQGSNCFQLRSTYLIPIEPGKYWENQSSDNLGTIKHCPAGAWCPGGTPPIYCPPGTYSQLIGQTDGSTCQECPNGYFCPGGSLKYICPVSYVCHGKDKVELCPAGFWCPGNGKAIACPSGTYSNQVGQTSSSTCQPCLEGYYCPGGSTLLPCPPGTFSHSYSSTVSKSCQRCPTGYYCPGGDFYLPCPGGSYQPAEGASSCIEAEPFTTSTYGSRGPTPCLPPFCNAYGSVTYFSAPIVEFGNYVYYANEKSMVAKVPEGFYRPTSSYYLMSCPSMHYCNGGPYEPQQCAAHLVTPDILPENLKSSYSEITPSITYDTFFGTQVTVTGHLKCIGIQGYQFEDQIFQECPAGTFSNASTNYLCTVCPAGYYSDIGSSQCNIAKPGYCIKSGCTAQSGVYACKPGTFCIWRNGHLVESECLPGFYCPGADSLPIPCIAGNYCQNAGMSEPQLCTGWSYTPAHTPNYQQENFGTYPITLLPGYSFSVTGTPVNKENVIISGWTSCLEPPLDTYALSNSPTGGNSFYHYCPPHKYASAETNNECLECQQGYGYDQDSRQCVDCARYITDNNNSAVSSHQTTCPCGQYLYDSLCVLAPIGSYIPLPVCNLTITVLPIPCPLGTFTARAGSWNCQPCPHGECSDAENVLAYQPSPYYTAELSANFSHVMLPKPVKLPLIDTLKETHVYHNNSVEGLFYHIHNYTFIRSGPTYKLENGTFIIGSSLILVHGIHNEKDIVYVHEKPIMLLSLLYHNPITNTKTFKYTNKLTLPDVIFSIKGGTSVHTEPITLEIKKEDMVCLEEFLSNTKLLNFVADHATFPTNMPSKQSVSSKWQMIKKSAMDGLSNIHMPASSSIVNSASGLKSTFSSAAQYWTNSTNIANFDKKALPGLGVGKELYDTFTDYGKPLCLRVSARHSIHTGFHLDYEFFKIRELLTSHSGDSNIGVMLPGSLSLKESSPILLLDSGMFSGGIHFSLFDGMLSFKLAPYMGFEINNLVLSGGDPKEYVYGLGHHTTHSARYKHKDGSPTEVTALLHNQDVSSDYFLLKPFTKFDFDLTTQFGVQLSLDATIFSFDLLLYDQPGLSGAFESANSFLCPSLNNSLLGEFNKTNNLILGINKVKILGLPVIPAIHQQWSLLDLISEPTCLSTPQFVPISNHNDEAVRSLAIANYVTEVVKSSPNGIYDGYNLVSTGTSFAGKGNTISPSALEAYIDSSIDSTTAIIKNGTYEVKMYLHHQNPEYDITIIDLDAKQNQNNISTYPYYPFHFNNHTSYRGVYVERYAQNIDSNLKFNNGTKSLIILCFDNRFSHYKLTYTDANEVPLPKQYIEPTIVSTFKTYLFNSNDISDEINTCVIYNIDNMPKKSKILYYPRVILKSGISANITIQDVVPGAAIRDFPYIIELPNSLYTDLDMITLRITMLERKFNESVATPEGPLYSLDGLNSTAYYYTSTGTEIQFATYDLKKAPYLAIRLSDRVLISASFEIELVSLVQKQIGSPSNSTILPVLTNSTSSIIPYSYFIVKINNAIATLSLAQHAYRIYEEGSIDNVPLIQYSDATLAATTHTTKMNVFLVKVKNEPAPPKRCISIPLTVYPDPIDNIPLPGVSGIFAPSFVSAPHVEKISMIIYNSITGEVQQLRQGTEFNVIDNIFVWQHKPIAISNGMSVQITAKDPSTVEFTSSNDEIVITKINTVYEVTIQRDCYITANATFYTLPNNIENTFVYATKGATLLIYSSNPVTLSYKPQTTLPRDEVHLISYNNGTFITRILGGINVAEKPLLQSLNIRVCDPIPNTEHCLIQDVVKRISAQTIEIGVPFDPYNIDKDMFITQGLGIPGNPQLVSIVVTDSQVSRKSTLSSFQDYPEGFQENSKICGKGFWRLTSIQQSMFPNQQICQVCPPGYYCINNAINQCPVATTSSEYVKSQCTGILELLRT